VRDRKGKRKLVAPLSLAAAIALALAAVTLADSQSTGWSAKLTAAQEIPKQVVKNSAASGLFTATLSGTKLKFKLTFAKLTGPATAAHIHLGAIGASGNVVVPLCAPCKSPVTGTVTVSAALQKDFTKHLLYVNVHTAKNPNGEIRGQLATATVTPASTAKPATTTTTTAKATTTTTSTPSGGSTSTTGLDADGCTIGTGIPQNNGGDGDGDNAGGASDGDGCL
jgi:hypothetical protein